MIAAARHVLVVFPCYLVVGHLLNRAPRPIAALVVGANAALLLIYGALAASARPWFF